MLSQLVRQAYHVLRTEGVRSAGRKSLAALTDGRQVRTLLTDPMNVPMSGPDWGRGRRVYREAFETAVEYVCCERLPGAVAEFGTNSGFTALTLAGLLRKYRLPHPVYLYDSFAGLPRIDDAVDRSSYAVGADRVWFPGAMAVPPGTADRVRRRVGRVVGSDRVHVTPGYFEDTLPAALPKEKLALVHVDCDLYQSAKFVLAQLVAADLFEDGCVILFDDFNCNRANPAFGERRALAETLGADGRLGYSLWFPYGWAGQAVFVHRRQPPGAGS